jgi:hypothetical protein
MKTDEIEAMKRAIAAYSGPVTRCVPGKARAKPLRKKKAVDDATRWLRKHRHPKPFVDGNLEAERGRRRKARPERTKDMAFQEVIIALRIEPPTISHLGPAPSALIQPPSGLMRA